MHKRSDLRENKGCINKHEDDGVDITDGDAIAVVRDGMSYHPGALPESQGIGAIGDEIEEAQLQCMSKGLLKGIDPRLGEQIGKQLLQTAIGIEGMHQHQMRQAGRSNGSGGIGVLGDATRILFDIVAAGKRHEEVARQHRHEHAGDNLDLDEGDDVRGDEVRDAPNDKADLLGRPGLDDLDVTDQAREHIAGGERLDEARFLLDHALKVAPPVPPGDPLADQTPAHGVDVEAAEIANGDIDDIQHLLVHSFGQMGAGALPGAAGDLVQAVDELAKDNSEQGEGDAGANCKDHAADDEEDILFRVIQGEEQPDIGKTSPGVVFGGYAPLQLLQRLVVDLVERLDLDWFPGRWAGTYGVRILDCTAAIPRRV